MDGEDGSDTYFGGKGADFLTEDPEECCEPSHTGNDEMNGGAGPDYIEGGEGDDILRGQAGDESEAGDPDRDVLKCSVAVATTILYGGTGDDAMEGDEGTDELHGGPDNDFIDAHGFDVGGYVRIWSMVATASTPAE